MSWQWNGKIIEAAGDDYLGGYINYFDSSLPKERYYGDKLPRLKRVKEKYDPENTFRREKGIWSQD